MRRTTRLALILSVATVPAIAGCGGETLTFPSGGSGGGGDGGTGGVGASGGTGGVGGEGATGGAGTTGGVGGTGGAPAECGDGVASGGEACDGDDFEGTSCEDYGYSSPAGLACTASCLVDASGCAATCDGALVEPGEDCDGANLDGHDCTEQGFASPDGVVCDGCALDYGGCAAACGNGVAEPGETCDGASVGMTSCADYGYVDPAGLLCNATCDDFDDSGCAASCNGTLEPGETCDGADLGGFDCTQLGFTNPAGGACSACQIDSSGCAPTCGDGTLEPGEQCDDGNLANGDGCSSTCTVGGLTCADALPVALPLGTQMLNGTTTGGGVFSGTCASAGPGRVYAVTPAAAGFLTASLTRANTAYQSVLFARTDCADPASQLLCADSKDPAGAVQLNGGEVISFTVAANQTVYVFVDGAGAADAGSYELVLDLSTGTGCGDPIPVRIEKGTPMTLLGFTTGKTNSTNGSCGGTMGDDVVYNVNFAGAAANVTAAIDAATTNFNSVLYARSSCDFNQLVCDNAAANGGESISFNPNGDASTYVWVDGSQGTNGVYSMVLTPAP